MALCGLCFFLNLGGLPLVGPDEPRYAEVGREMFASGDWITPRLAGHLWFEKPVLLYWGQALSYHLFGVNEWAARFPSALAASMTVLFVAHAVRRLASAQWGFLAGATLSTCAFWFALARAASTDMVLACSIGVAVLAGYVAFNTAGRERVFYWLLFSVALGASMLAKGLIGILLICGILLIHRLLLGRPILTSLRRNALLVAGGALVFLATSASWYAPVWLINGQTFWHEFFVRHHFERFTSNEFHHQQPAYFYLFIAIVGVVPWTFFLPAALARLRRLQARDDARGALLLLCWVWAALPIAFFSLSGSKLPAYVLPSFPALAILIGAELERIWSGKGDRWSRFALGATAIMVCAIGIGGAVYLWREGVAGGSVNWRIVFAFLPPIFGFIALGAWASGARRNAIGASVALTASVVVAAALILFGPLGQKLSKKQISVAVFEQLKPGESVIFYHKQKEYAPVFYAQGRVLFYEQKLDAQGQPIEGQGKFLPPGTLSRGDEIDALTPAELMLALDNPGQPSAIVITKPDEAAKLEADARFGTQRVAQQDKVVALRVWRRP